MPVSTCADGAEANELFEGVRARDASAWECFVDRYGPLVQSVPVRAGLKGADADDVIQATWLQLLRHAPLIREPRSIPAWILTTAAREAWRVRARRTAQSREVNDALELDPAGEDLSDHELLRLERVQVVRDAVAALGARCRALLDALFLRARPASYETIAVELGIAIGSIGPTRQRCLAKLAFALEGSGFALEDQGPSSFGRSARRSTS